MPTGDAPMVAAGAAVRAPDGKVLFVQRHPDASHGGTWCFPGGGAEDGESVSQTASRELQEETGRKVEPDAMRAINRQIAGGVDYTTHVAHVPEAFTPTLCDENTDHRWAPLDDAPQPLHPGVASTIAGVPPEDWKPRGGAPAQDAKPDVMALDRATVRSKDRDGRLHVSVSAISKANVCGYAGNEIPGWQDLGLDRDRIYQMFRDPEELAKAISTFNGIQVLSKHIPIDAWNHRPDLVIGCTGTDAEFDAPYLKNSLSIWTDEAIEGVESERKKEISSAYYYTPDMTPGSYEGTHYDGVMRDIKANHVALVVEGRAGTDVVVGDSKKDFENMPLPAFTRKAMLVQGALIAHLSPRLAADAKIDFLTSVAGITHANFPSKKGLILTRVAKETRGHLAADASLDDVVQLLDKLDDAGAPDAADADLDAAIDPDDKPADKGDPDAMAGDDDVTGKVKEFLKGKLSDEDFAELEAMMSATPVKADDADPDAATDPDDDDGDKGAADPIAGDDEGDDEPVSPAAMDAAIKTAVSDAVAKVKRDANETQDALRHVRPWTGELAMSFDSADAVYRHALTALGVANAATIHPSALGALLDAQPKPSARGGRKSLAQDERARTSYAETFPETAHLDRR